MLEGVEIAAHRASGELLNWPEKRRLGLWVKLHLLLQESIGDAGGQVQAILNSF